MKQKNRHMSKKIDIVAFYLTDDKVSFSEGNFKRVLIQKNALSLEIRKDHLIYGNIHKVVAMYCD